MCPLPNPIPTNKPNVEPKRPPRLGFCHFETLLQTKGSVLCLRMTVKSTKIDILKCFVQANQHHPTVQVVSNLGQHGQCQVGSWLRWDLNYVTWLRGAWQFDMIFSGKGWVVGIWLVEKLSSEQVIIILWIELNWIEFIVLKRMYKGTLMVAHLYLFKEQLKMTTKLYHPYPFPER